MIANLLVPLSDLTIYFLSVNLHYYNIVTLYLHKTKIYIHVNVQTDINTRQRLYIYLETYISSLHTILYDI